MNEGPAAPFYVVGGTMAPGSPSYIARRADEELYRAVLDGEFCYVLTARQMGKSSLMARTVHRLRHRHVSSAVVDLTQIGGAKSGITPEQWYYGIAHAIQRQLTPGVDSRAWWRERGGLHAPQRLFDLLRECARANTARVAVFVDEIDASIDFPFSDEFFAAVRACYNARALDAAFTRLTFVLLGVSTPQDLIRDQQQTPFNIGRGIELTDFTGEEALPLASGMAQPEGRAGALLQRVLHWTGGQPYLTQALCRDAGKAARGDHRDAADIVDLLVNRTYFSAGALRDDHHLKFINARLTAQGGSASLLDTYRQVASGVAISHLSTSPVHAALRLSGVVKPDAHGHLKVRNRIYATVFTAAWATDLERTLSGASGGTGSTVGGYEIGARLGEGGSSIAFLGRRIDSGTTVVIKRSKTRSDVDTRMRMERLGQVLTALRHPHIAEVYDYLEDAGVVLVVEEYLPGGSLASVLSREGRIPERQACEWCRDALSALDYAHQHGIVHRNVKPSNLMLDAMRQVKVIDFELARTFWGDARVTRLRDEAIGTPAYMSPEQIVSPGVVDHLTDVYSMGVVLYELLAGAPPFEGPSPFAVHEKILRQPSPPLHRLNPQVSPGLEKIVLRALEKDPSRRYGGAAEFALVLYRYLAGRSQAEGSDARRPWPQRLYSAMRDRWEETLANRRRR